MKKFKIFVILALIVIMGLSLYFSISFLKKVEVESFIQYLPIVIFILSFALFIALVIGLPKNNSSAELENRLKMWNAVTYKVKKAGETAFNNLPIGVIVLDKNYKIVWSNPTARTIFMSPLENIDLTNLTLPLYEELIKLTPKSNPKINPENSESQVENPINENTQVSWNSNIYGKIYFVTYLPYYQVIYLTDRTDYEELQTRYYNRTEVLGYINIDNIEESLKELDVQTKSEYEGRVFGAINKWANEFEIFVRGLTSTRYILITDQQHLEKLMESQFSILKDIRHLFNTSRITQITLSMGIACNDTNINSLSDEAQAQLELALSRGGDQVVVKKNSQITIIGATTDPIVNDSKVEMRINSEKLTNLMQNSSKVFVNGHKMIDADGFAATIAIYRWAKKLGKKAYIIYDPNSIDTTVAKIFKTIKEEYTAYMEAFIVPSQISKYIDKESLLMVVDYQTIYQAIDPHLFNRFEKIGIIDHHRRGNGAIANPKFIYSQVSASSSVELIFELMSFMDEHVEFTELEATWMLLGIVVDTNNFVYRASSTTFEVASTLKKYGADMNVVKEYLKEDLKEKTIRYEAIDTTEMYRDNIAIAKTNDDTIYDRAFLAKVSDELISVSNVDLAIAVGRIGENQIGLSARSLGKINCQVIMEKMGGGGHLNNAAAQRRNETIEQCIEVLHKMIDEYLVEEESMKIILIKDLKGRGKKGDVIDVAPGFGNNLISNDTAILASPENLKKLEQEKNQAIIKEAELLQEMKDLKEKIEQNPVKVKVKVGKEGKLFGSVTSKQIIDEIYNQMKIKLDKHKLDLAMTINSLGEYEIPIRLHKEVTATIHLYVIEG